MIAFIILVLFNVADIGLTLYALRLGAVELNPILGPLMTRYGPATVLIFAKVCVLPAAWFLLRGTPALLWLTIAYGFLLLWNLSQIRSMLKRAKA